ncbi:hypothetical protein [Ruegeria faecimaris]|uniref:hypothetical protein n=1 Tax=Ruegeria faecimaris TaxID=686389 RepID=UPI00248FA3C5|nr:hypothetical protein [Ruegeria faecimaris]
MTYLIAIGLPLLVSTAVAILIGLRAYHTARATKENGKEWLLPLLAYGAACAPLTILASYALTDVFVDRFAVDAGNANPADVMVYFQLQFWLIAIPVGFAIIFAFARGLRA